MRNKHLWSVSPPVHGVLLEQPGWTETMSQHSAWQRRCSPKASPPGWRHQGTEAGSARHPAGKSANRSRLLSSGSLEARTPPAKPTALTRKIFGFESGLSPQREQTLTQTVGRRAGQMFGVGPFPWPPEHPALCSASLPGLPGPCLGPFVLKLVSPDLSPAARMCPGFVFPTA